MRMVTRRALGVLGLMAGYRRLAGVTLACGVALAGAGYLLASVGPDADANIGVEFPRFDGLRDLPPVWWSWVSRVVR